MLLTITDYFQRAACFFSPFVEEEAEKPLCLTDERYSLATTVKTGLLFACSIPLIALCANRLRQAVFPKLTDERSADLAIESFWNRHVHSFTLNHGTTALYYRHFQEHGISSSYPLALEEIVTKIKDVWKNHQEDICPYSQYFEWFEKRYENACYNQEIAISFSAQKLVTSEFTTGVRRGGEWIKEMRSFLRDSSGKLDCLSAEERDTVLKMEALIDVIDSVSPMVVTIRPSTEETHAAFTYDPLLSPLPTFLAYVKNSCQNWQNSNSLSHFLKEDLLPKLELLKQGYKEQYEITVTTAIPAKHLEFTFLENHVKKEPPHSYPKLALDQPTLLSHEEIISLQIERTGFTDIEEYKDSRFFCDYLVESNHWQVTRKAFSSKDLQDLALRNMKKEMRKEWIRAFVCEDHV